MARRRELLRGNNRIIYKASAVENATENNFAPRAPVPSKGWEGIWNATQEGVPCIQRDYILNEKGPIFGREDCLYLNVYVPLLHLTIFLIRNEETFKEKIFLTLEIGRNPTPQQNSLTPVNWEPVKPNELRLLEIGGSPNGLEMRPFSQEVLKRYEFWESLQLSENENYTEQIEKDEISI
ncbi:hypothetical protein J437_LFUL010966 [Ladona fulva]|uniref:Carboxylesterase type B domain-containing protein n=1 Tax=Ladona fulva TaxID=123851 RepID=A0A8K0KH46_LADFU|nr:hypothetical protein J437_LFUL010966 [Ladona fulva]